MSRLSVKLPKSMKKMTKSQATSVSRQLTAKAQSWGQVAKQLSGMIGKIKVGKDSISIHEAFIRLGVQTKANKYTAQDLAKAWNERLKEGQAMHTQKADSDNSWRCPLFVKSVPLTAELGDKVFKLYASTDKGYKGIRKQILSRVVKAEDKDNNTDTIVSAQVVLKGLVQSMFVEQTLAELSENEAEVSAISEAYIEVEEGKYERVIKDVHGMWTKAVDVVVEVKEEKKKTKRTRKVA